MTHANSSSLAAARRQFVDLWGQMAPHWGINRTMAQIHALLMISPRPLTAEQVMEELRISRGNVSMNLRELGHWGIVRRTSIPGDRRDFFTTEGDVWVMFYNIFRERKRRELDPLLNRLADCAKAAGPAAAKIQDEAEHSAFTGRMQELMDFFSVFHALFARVLDQPPGELAKMAKSMEKLI